MSTRRKTDYESKEYSKSKRAEAMQKLIYIRAEKQNNNNNTIYMVKMYEQRTENKIMKPQDPFKWIQ